MGGRTLANCSACWRWWEASFAAPSCAGAGGQRGAGWQMAPGQSLGAVPLRLVPWRGRATTLAPAAPALGHWPPRQPRRRRRPDAAAEAPTLLVAYLYHPASMSGAEGRHRTIAAVFLALPLPQVANSKNCSLETGGRHMAYLGRAALIYVFQSLGTSTILALTSDSSGAILPGDGAGWAATGAVEPLARLRTHAAPAAITCLRQTGFLIVEAETLTRSLAPLLPS